MQLFIQARHLVLSITTYKLEKLEKQHKSEEIFSDLESAR